MAKRIVTKNNVFKMNVNEQLPLFLKMIQDLTQIDDRILFKFNNDKLLIYSMVGQDTNIHAFKSHIIDMCEIFSLVKNEFETDIKYTVKNAKKFFKSIQGLINYKEDIDLKLVYNEDNFGEKLMIKNSIYKREFAGDDPTVFKKDINIEAINDAMDTDLSSFSFKLTKDKYDHIKKESGIDTENEIYFLNVRDGAVSLGENSWELKVDEGVETIDSTISFPKKYFNSINFDKDIDELTIWVFDMFILVIGENTNLMISIELTI